MVTGVILAGGENRRMGGKHKALLAFGEEKLIQRQIRLIAPICSEIIVVTNEPKLFLPLVDRSVRIITDFYPGTGPLGGMHAALSLARNEAVWVLGCDMPFVSAPAAREMSRQLVETGVEAVVPFLHGKLHPLHAVYRKSCVPKAAELLEAGKYKVTGLLERIVCSRMDEDDFGKLGIDTRFVVNANTPDEWGDALRMSVEGDQAG